MVNDRFVEDFRTQPEQIIESGKSVELSTMKVTNYGQYGRVQFMRDSVPGLFTGFPGGITGGVARLDLKSPARSVSIYPGILEGLGRKVTFYSEGDLVLGSMPIPDGELEVTFAATGVLSILRVDLDGYHMGGLCVNGVAYTV